MGFFKIFYSPITYTRNHKKFILQDRELRYNPLRVQKCTYEKETGYIPTLKAETRKFKHSVQKINRTLDVGLNSQDFHYSTETNKNEN